jgi:excisionase family DNA binding protein
MSNVNSSFDPLEALTVRQVAELWHVSQPTVRKRIRAAELPSITIGRCRRVRRMDAEAFLDGRTAYGWQRHRAGPPPIDDEPGYARPPAAGGEEIAF